MRFFAFCYLEKRKRSMCRKGARLRYWGKNKENYYSCWQVKRERERSLHPLIIFHFYDNSISVMVQICELQMKQMLSFASSCIAFLSLSPLNHNPLAMLYLSPLIIHPPNRAICLLSRLEERERERERVLIPPSMTATTTTVTALEQKQKKGDCECVYSCSC